jgi:hypothetical protein
MRRCLPASWEMARAFGEHDAGKQRRYIYEGIS